MISLQLNDAVIKSLSRHELNILRYVYEHSDAVQSISIQEFSARVSYSSATVLRFCRKLGYSGFAEFKYALRSAQREAGQAAEASGTQAGSPDFRIDLLSSNIQATATLIQEEQLNQTFHFLNGQGPIYIWSPGGITDITAEYLEKLLFSIGRQDVYKIESARLFEHLIRGMRSDALIVLISASGSFGTTVRLAKLAQMNGIPILSITPYTSNEIADLATVSFRFFTDQRENLGAEYTSRLPIFFIIRTIIQCYLDYKAAADQEGGAHDPSV